MNSAKTSFVFLLLGILLPIVGLAQENQCVRRGNFSIGSGVGYVNSVSNIQIDNGTTVTKGGTTAYQIHLTPTIGYFLANNFVLGLGMDYLASTSKDTNADDDGEESSSDTKILFGPYTRLYLPFAGDQAFFLGAVYGYGKSDTEITVDGGRQNANTTLTTLGVGPGYALFSNRRVSLEAQVKYNYGISRNVINVDGLSQNTRTLVTAWDFTVGFNYYFGRRQ
jgi:hypothetical protein